jgi:hypothetical protein
MCIPKEVYRNRQGCVYQDDCKNCFVLECNGYATPLSVNCFFYLKKQFDRVDILAIVNDPLPQSDIIIISPPSCDRFFALTLPELLEFKDLFTGARAMLELNSILHERVYTSVFS